MIRAGVLEPAVKVEPAETAECPNCCGNGVVYVERLFGRNAPEPYRTEPCGACSGTGTAPAEAVVYCDDCGLPVWADQVCEHQLGTLCLDHTPRCGDCIGDRSDR